MTQYTNNPEESPMKIDNLTVPVTVEVDLNAILKSAQPEGYDFVNDEVIHGGPLYRDLVQAAASKLADEARETIRKEVSVAAAGFIASEVAAIVHDTLEGGVQETNVWGTKQVAKPLREVVADEVKGWVSGKAEGYDRNAKSKMQKLVADEVDRALQQDFKALLAEERGKAVERIRQIAADLLAVEATKR